MSLLHNEDFYRFLRGKKNLSTVTVKGMIGRIPNTLSNLDDPEQLYRYYFSVLDRDTSSAHKRQIHYALKYYCEYKNWEFDFKPPKQHMKRRQHSQLEDIWKLIEVIEDKRDLAIIMFHLYTGLRPSELLTLELKDVDLDHGLVKIRDTKTYMDRIVPVNRKAISILKKYLMTREDNFPLLFKSYRWDKQVSLRAYRCVLTKYCNKANLNNITPYMIRHTFATCYVENGGNIKALKEILGHRQIKTTEIYIHESEKIVKKDYERACPDF